MQIANRKGIVSMKRSLNKIICFGLAGMLLVSPMTAEAKAKKKPCLSKTSISLQVGKSCTLKVKNNKKKVKWSTSSKKIAKVTKKGKVTAVQKGTCRVYAKVSGKKLSCRVVVYAPKSSTSSTTEAVKNNNSNKTTESTKKPNTNKTTEKTTAASSKTTENTKKDCSTLGHDTEVVTTNATCDKAGSEVTKCKRCGEVLSTKSIPALGHDWSGGYKTHDQSNCKLSGSTGINYCMRCGKMETFVYDTVDHNIVTDSVTATCTTGGTAKTYCKDCGKVFATKNTSALGHNWVTDKEVAWTCTTDGWVEKHCSRCGEKKAYAPAKPSTTVHSGNRVTKGETLNMALVGHPELGYKLCIVTRCSDCNTITDYTQVQE